MIKEVLFTLAITLFLVSCKSDEQIIEPELEPFIGTWVMEQVVHDGTSLEEWEQVEITFEQESEGEGTYSIPNSPDHFVWHPEGLWSIADKTEFTITFVMNDTSYVTVFANNEETMSLVRDLPWTSNEPPCDINDPDVEACVLPLYGIWSFFLTKED